VQCVLIAVAAGEADHCQLHFASTS
jgi:hypothetical protein